MVASKVVVFLKKPVDKKSAQWQRVCMAAILEEPFLEFSEGQGCSQVNT